MPPNEGLTDDELFGAPGGATTDVGPEWVSGGLTDDELFGGAQFQSQVLSEMRRQNVREPIFSEQLRPRPADVETFPRPSEVAGDVGPVIHAAGAAGKAFAGGVAGLPKAVAVSAHWLNTTFPRFAKAIGDNPDKDLKEYVTWRAGQVIEDWATQHAPEDPALRGSFMAETLPAAAGSAASFIFGGALGRAAKVPAWLTVAGMGAGSTASGQYEEAKSFGADKKTAEAAAHWGSLLGLSEAALGVGRIFNRFDKATGGKFKSTAANLVVQGFTGGAEELVQESLAQVGSNAISRIYDRERSLINGIFEAGGAGGIVGFAANVIAAAAGARVHRDVARKITQEQHEAALKIAKDPNPSRRDVAAAGITGPMNSGERAALSTLTAEVLAEEEVKRAQEEGQQAEIQKAIAEQGLTGPGAGPVRGGTASESDPAYAAQVASPTRIAPSPIPGGVAKPLRQIQFKAGRVFGGRIRTAKMRASGVKGGTILGTYFPSSRRTTIRFAGDLDVSAHEMSHALDDEYGIVPRGDATFDAELVPAFSAHTSPPNAPIDYQRGEGVAEWIRAYVVNPDEAVAAAPNFARHVIDKLPPVIKKRLDAFSFDVRNWLGASPVQQTLSNVEMRMTPSLLAESTKESLEGSEGEFKTTWIDKVGTVVNDVMGPVYKAFEFAKRLRGLDMVAPSDNTKILMRNYAGFGLKYQDVLENGPITAAGERAPGIGGGLAWLFEPLDRSTMEAFDASLGNAAALLVSERAIEKYNIWKAAATDIATLEPQIAPLEAQLAVEPDPAARKLIAKDIAQLKAAVAAARKRLGIRGPYAGPADKALAFAEKRASTSTGTGAGFIPDQVVAQKTIAQVRAMPDYSKIREATDRYRLWADSILRYMVEQGNLGIEEYETIRASNEHYAAMDRIFEDLDPESQRAANQAATKGLKKFTGSTRTIANPYVNLISQTEALMRLSDRNAAMASFVRILDAPRGMHQGPPLDLDSIGSRAKEGDLNAIRIKRAGVDEWWQFNPQIHKALKSWNETESTNFVYKALQWFPKLMRASIVYSPPFLVRNVIKDPIYRSIVSRAGSKPWTHLYYLTPQGAAGFKEDLSEFYRAGGGLFGHHGQTRQDYYKTLRDVMQQQVESESGKSVFTFPARLAKGYGKMARMSELIGRLAEYRKARDKFLAEGYAKEEAMLAAAFEARDIQDYAVAGSAIGTISKYLIFTNASVRSLARTLQAGKENKARFAARWMAYVGVPTLAAYAWNYFSGDDEENSQQPDYLRDLFWNFKAGPDLWIRIPKPWELGVFASGMERGLDAARGKPHAFDGWGSSLISTLSPVDDTALLGPWRAFGEAAMNYDMFRQKHIVPPWEANLDVELRKGSEKASRVGQIVQKAIGMDGRKFDHILQTQFGAFGRIGTKLTDIGRPERPGLTEAAREAAGVLARSPAYAAKDVQYIMDLAKRRGMMNHPIVKELDGKLKAYFDAEGAEAKDKAAADVRAFASSVRDELPTFFANSQAASLAHRIARAEPKKAAKGKTLADTKAQWKADVEEAIGELSKVGIPLNEARELYKAWLKDEIKDKKTRLEYERRFLQRAK